MAKIELSDMDKLTIARSAIIGNGSDVVSMRDNLWNAGISSNEAANDLVTAWNKATKLENCDKLRATLSLEYRMGYFVSILHEAKPKLSRDECETIAVRVFANARTGGATPQEYRLYNASSQALFRVKISRGIATRKNATGKTVSGDFSKAEAKAMSDKRTKARKDSETKAATELKEQATPSLGTNVDAYAWLAQTVNQVSHMLSKNEATFKTAPAITKVLTAFIHEAAMLKPEGETVKAKITKAKAIKE